METVKVMMKDSTTIDEKCEEIITTLEKELGQPLRGTMGYANFKDALFSLAYTNLVKDVVLKAFIEDEKRMEMIINATRIAMDKDDRELIEERKNETRNEESTENQLLKNS